MGVILTCDAQEFHFREKAVAMNGGLLFGRLLQSLVALSAAAFIAGLAVLVTAPGSPGLFTLPGKAGEGVPEDAGARRLTAPIRAALEGRAPLTAAALASGALDGKVVALTFFASWCAPCRQELAQLKWLHGKYGDQGLVVLAVNYYETFDGLSDRARLGRFLERLGPPFPVIAGDDALAETFGGVFRIPTLLVYDRQGRPVSTFINASPARSTVDMGELEAVVRGLL